MSADPRLREFHNNNNSDSVNHIHNDGEYILFHSLFKRHIIEVLKKICLRCSNPYLQNDVKYCMRCKIKVPSKITIDDNISTINAVYEFPLTGNKIVKVLTAKRCYEIIDCVSDSICALLGFPKDQHPRQLFTHVKVDDTGYVSQMYHHAPSSNSVIKYNSNKYKFDGDFDGDETTTSIPQNEQNKLELSQLKSVTNQTISPSNNSPLINKPYLPKKNVPIKSRLPVKTGRVLPTLMAKRCTYQRPFRCMNIEIAIPVKIAMKITREVVVTEINRIFLTTCVRNGAGIYPGANSVKFARDGSVMQLNLDVDYCEIELNNGDVVRRHLLNDDMIYEDELRMHNIVSVEDPIGKQVRVILFS